MAAIRIVLDITRLVEEGKLTAQEAERLQAFAKRDTGSLAINVLMSLGAVAVAAGIIALQPAFTTGAALVSPWWRSALPSRFSPPSNGAFSVPPLPSSARSCWQAESSGLSRPISPGSPSRRSYFLALAVAIRSNFLMALVPLTLAGALGSSTGYQHAVYMLTVNEPSITIAFFALLAGAAYIVSQHIGQAYQQLAVLLLGIVDSRQFRLLSNW